MGRTHAKYKWMDGAFPLVYDNTTRESILPLKITRFSRFSKGLGDLSYLTNVFMSL